jgi:hypothetical protein
MLRRCTRALRARHLATLIVGALALSFAAGCATEPSTDRPVALSLSDSPARALSLALGVSTPLQVTVRSGSGASLPLADAVAFAARDTGVATVDRAGLVASRGPGSTWVVGTLETRGRRLVDSVRVTVLCTSELSARLPMQTTLAVGQAFTPSVELRSCGGRVVLTDEFTWATSDTTVVRVDTGTGRTVGRAPGRALVLPTGRRYGQIGWIDVTVTP